MAGKGGHTYLLFICLGLIVLGFAAVSCGDDPEVAQRIDGADYFPLSDSLTRVYEVEEINISPLGGADTLRYELLVTVGDRFVNSSGIENWNLYHYRRADAISEWAFAYTTPIRIEDGNYIVTENNIPYVKLASPVFDGKEWDGNAYNASSPDTYTAGFRNTLMLEQGQVEGNDWLVVTQEELRDTIVTQDIRREVYGKDIGLVHREVTLLNYCTRPECLGEGIIEDGRVYKQTLENLW